MLGTHILVVDDDAVLADLIAQLLRNEGADTMSVANGALALVAARARRPDLIILDAQMPVMDGFEALHELKADRMLTHIPVLMLTAMRSAADVRRARDLGASDYIAKPFNQQTLLARVKGALRRQSSWATEHASPGLPEAAAQPAEDELLID